jgi:hypothetical protein
MNQSVAVCLSVVVVYGLVILIGKRFKKPSRYERTPRVLNSWNALDKGIDPSDEKFS